MVSRIDAPKLAARAGLKKPVKAPVFKPTAAQEAQLTRLVSRVITGWNAALRDDILPAYRSAIARRAASGGLILGGLSVDLAEVEAALDRATAASVRTVGGVEPEVAVFFQQFAAWHTARWTAALETATKAPVRPYLSPQDADDLIRAAIRRNVALIKGLDAEMARKIERAVFDAWNKNDSAPKLIRVLKKELGFAPARAKLIGFDQIGKLAGEIDRFRHEEAGIPRFVWERTLSAHPREEHLELVGRVFEWKRPPYGVIPGELINCRCRARAYIEPKD